MAIVKRDVYKCDRCGHEWFSRYFGKENPPLSCAKCKSRFWNGNKASKERTLWKLEMLKKYRIDLDERIAKLEDSLT